MNQVTVAPSYKATLNVMTRLGLTERKSSPDPIKFNENDPLGSKLMQNSKTNASTVIESLSKCVI
jgi:hypothetical protein